MRGEMYIVISCWSGDFYEAVKAVKVIFSVEHRVLFIGCYW